jgi:hypothetical protein
LLPLALTLLLLALNGSWALAQGTCEQLFKATEIKGIDLKYLEESKLEHIHSETLTVAGLPAPITIEVREIRESGPTSYAIMFHQIGLKYESDAYSKFVHEIGHILVKFNLYNSVPAFREIIQIVDRQMKLDRATDTKEILRLNEEFKLHPDLLQFSRYFEEVFSDLLAVAVTKKPDVMEDGRGFRDFRDNLIGKRIPGYYGRHFEKDPHYLLQPLGRHIYSKYLVPEKARPDRIFQVFFKLIKNEIENAKDSEFLHMSRPLVNEVADGVYEINGKRTDQYLEELKIKFDRLMSEPNA